MCHRSKNKDNPSTKRGKEHHLKAKRLAIKQTKYEWPKLWGKVAVELSKKYPGDREKQTYGLTKWFIPNFTTARELWE